MTDGERFAAGPAVEEIREHLNVDVELLEMAELGDSGGAAYIRWPDGRVGVLTRPVTTLERMQLTAEVLAFAKERGLPVPRHELVVRLRDGEVAVVQERLPGAPVERVTVDVIDAMWVMNERFAGLLADRPEVPVPSLCLLQSGPDYPRHELLERYSDRTRRMLRRIRQLGAEPPLEMTGSDLLHLDFARGNVLFDERGQVSGVVDWNLGVARGDRRLALACLRNDLEWSVLNPRHNQVDRNAIDRLDEILQDQVEPVLLQKFCAHWTLQKLHWAILENASDVVELFLGLGERQLGME